MREDYLPGTPYTILQNPQLYQMNSDSELLGQFIRVRHDDHVLDIGCGSGVLMLYALQQKPASVCGIDLFPEITEAARINIERNGLEAELYTGRVQDFVHERFDLIICNPPYFSNSNPQLHSESKYIDAARHDTHLTIEELFAAVSGLLKQKGRFAVVYRPEGMNRIMHAAYSHGMCPAVIQPVRDIKKNKIRTVLMEFVFGTNRDTEFRIPVEI